MSHRLVSLLVFLASVVLASWIAASFEAGAWFERLVKPPFTPPHWLFGPLWAIAYVFMAVAAWRTWESGHSMKAAALVWWILYVALGVFSVWLIFELNRTGWAMASAGLTLCLGLMCWRAFGQVSRPAGGLMIPPLLWSGFVLWLDYQFWSLNGGGLGSLFGS